jgi:ribosomal protein S18 acetylase RimI-like enzyme
MIRLRPSSREELDRFDAMDRQAHACDYVLQTGIKTHRHYFDDPRITYLSIEDDGEFCGYFILVFDTVNASVEFRRILVDQHRRGIGQPAIAEMERYCKRALAAERIWLDVFEDNEVGIHIYQKMGYARFKQALIDGRRLYFYEKAL